MEVTFFNLNDDGEELKLTLDAFFLSISQSVNYHVIKDNDYKAECIETDIIFYRIVDAIACFSYSKRLHTPNIKKIAICETYKQGIEALGNGSIYALQVPIQPFHILKCCYIMME